MQESAVLNRTEIANIKRLYDTGKISRELAKELAEPILKTINTKSAEIAKNHGKKSYPKLGFSEVMRNSY